MGESALAGRLASTPTMHSPDHALLTIVAAIGCGLACQVIAHRWRVPAIVLLLLSGVALGPEGAGWIRPANLGDGLAILVKLAVAVVLFEGALNLRLGDLRAAAREVRGLVTVGVLVSGVLTSLAARYVAQLSWPTACLFGALMTVTGPTVVQPLLRRISVSRRLKTVLEGEAILVDPIGAILAVAALDVVLGLLEQRPAGVTVAVWAYVGRISIGALVGGAGGWLLSRLFKGRWQPPAELANLVLLTAVWCVFGLAELAKDEAGIMAAVAMGLVFQRESVPGLRQLRRFQEELTVLAISLLFVLLAANLELAGVAREGVRGLALVLAVMLVIRPLSVFAATRRTSLNLREKLFVAWIGPRGIVAASVASLFALSLSGLPAAEGDRLVPLTFMAIALTVTLEGGTASLVAGWLGLSSLREARVIVVGSGPLARAVARLLQAVKRPVTLVDRNEEAVRRARQAGLDAVVGNALEEDVLAEAGADEAASLIALTTNSEVNVLAAQRAHESFRIERALAAVAPGDAGPARHLLEGTRGRLAFGRPIDVRPWDASWQREPLSLRWKPARGSAVSGPASLPASCELLPVARVRGGSAEIVHDAQTWEPGDEILFLVRPGEDAAAQLALLEAAPAPQR